MKNRHVLLTLPPSTANRLREDDTVTLEVEIDQDGDALWPIAVELTVHDAGKDRNSPATWSGHIMGNSHGGKPAIPITGNHSALSVAYCLARLATALVQGQVVESVDTDGAMSRRIIAAEDAGELRHPPEGAAALGADLAQTLHSVVTRPGVRGAVLVAIANDGLFNRHELARVGTQEEETRLVCELIGGVETAKALLTRPMTRQSAGPNLAAALAAILGPPPPPAEDAPAPPPEETH